MKGNNHFKQLTPSAGSEERTSHSSGTAGINWFLNQSKKLISVIQPFGKTPYLVPNGPPCVWLNINYPVYTIYGGNKVPSADMHPCTMMFFFQVSPQHHLQAQNVLNTSMTPSCSNTLQTSGISPNMPTEESHQLRDFFTTFLQSTSPTISKPKQ